MKFFEDDSKVPLPCPGCGGTITKTLLAWRQSSGTCPHCGTIYMGDAMSAQILEIERNILKDMGLE